MHFATKRFATSTDCIAIRPKHNAHIDASYAYQYFKGNMQVLENGFKGAGLKHISKGYLSEIQIPHPESTNDQIRIAHLLGKVERLISQRKQSLQQLDDLLKSVFLDMFGDPVRNEKGWNTVPFHQAGKFISGGTPSKSRDDFWNGDFPWVSPKDMKVTKIDDAIDHISETVFEQTSLKRIAPNHLLIVVRGMILVHSFPVAINSVDIAINQDMKAIKPIREINVVYLLNCLNSLKRQILKLISTAGHGTRKFDSVAMQKLFIPKPPEDLQNQFAAIAEKIETLKSRYQQSLADMECLYGALSQHAFNGELDLTQVPTTQDVTAASQGEQATMPAPVVQTVPAIHLPDTGNLLVALEHVEARKTLIAEWLEAYRAQLADTPFSLQYFMELAQNRLAEIHPDNDFVLGTSDFEHIKAWVFEALATGKLTQAFDDSGNCIELKASIEQSLT
ncbi:Type I restriction-modification system, specificity subunit S [Yersinia enterocolitica]|nr:Type I restriction-modification system, specificity subunit S [Yersinia enterocolitica]